MGEHSSPTSASGPATARADLVLLGVAVVAISTSAPLVRAAAAPTLAVAFWRNALAVPLVGAAALAQRGQGTPVRRDVRLSVLAGLCLAAHFGTWIPSLSFTTVASSVALVATQPVWAALLARARGDAMPRGTWAGIALAVAGAALLGGLDFATSGRALFGDALALAGGVLAAVYVTVGADVRQSVSTAWYATICYSTASLVLVAVCAAGGQSLAGYDGDTWLAIAAIAAGPQLLGHTVMNRVLRTITPTVVSVAILLEVLGAAALARVFYDESPRPLAWPAGALLLAGVVIVVRAARPRDEVPSPAVL